jgi:hypothetical protein
MSTTGGGVVYLTVDQVVRMHDEEALPMGRGLGGIRSHQQLAAAVFQPQQSAFGEDAYKTIPEKAAASGTSSRRGSRSSTRTNERRSSR